MVHSQSGSAAQSIRSVSCVLLKNEAAVYHAHTQWHTDIQVARFVCKKAMGGLGLGLGLGHKEATPTNLLVADSDWRIVASLHHLDVEN